MKSALTLSFALFLLLAGADAAAQIERLTLVAPAAPGGGWDQTARAMQHALESARLARVVTVENVPGAAGTIGLAQFIDAYRGRDDALLVTGLVMVGAIVFNQSPVSLARVTAVARLTGEYEVVAVPAASPLGSMQDLIDALRRDPGAVSWGGGSAGGTDHILAGLVAVAAGIDPRRVNYIAFSGGGEAVTALLGSQVTVGVSGASEFAAHVAAGRLRLLAVSAPARVADVDAPTLRDAGLDVELANWRGLVAPPDLREDQRHTLTRLIGEMVKTSAWQNTLRTRGWTDLFLDAEQFATFLDAERGRVARIASRLRPTDTSSGAGRWLHWLFPAIALAGALAVAAWLAWQRHAGLRPPDITAVVNRRAMLRVGLGLAVFVALAERIGFIIASSALFYCVASAFETPRRVRALVVALLFATTVYFTFTRGLGLALPSGAWMSWTR